MLYTVVFQDLKEFLISAGATHLLDTRHQRLSEKHRRQLIRYVAEFAMVKFGDLPKPEQKEAVAKAVIFLFPPLKSTTSKTGTVSFDNICLIIDNK